MNGYEMVIGLEVHVELKTKTKIFCSCPNVFGAPANTQCCPVCLGLPGSLPTLNRRVVEYAVKAGMALHCEIARNFRMDRKNYFYPDLPKAYQISQYDHPLCQNGYLEIDTPQGRKRIGVTRIHIEEDAGKLIHDKISGTLIDCNRCGVPLIEIVSEPDLRSADEVKEYLKQLRSILLYIGISDCRMNEGSLRCDVNLSVRKAGETTLGVRTEMKNLNSFQYVGKAIAFEAERQIALLQAGRPVAQETRRYDEVSGRTVSLRSKETQSDYRFFTEPDLPPIVLNEDIVKQWKAELPVLPEERKQRYVEQYHLSPLLAEVLTAERVHADYFETLADLVSDIPAAAALMQSQLLVRCGQDQPVPILPERMAQVCRMVEKEVISNASARKVIAALWEQDFDPEEFVETHQMRQISDPAVLGRLADAAIAADAKSVQAYCSGREAAARALIGKVMKASGGRNPNMICRIVLEKLSGKKAEK